MNNSIAQWEIAIKCGVEWFLMVKGEKSLEHCNEKSNLKYKSVFHICPLIETWKFPGEKRKSRKLTEMGL